MTDIRTGRGPTWLPGPVTALDSRSELASERRAGRYSRIRALGMQETFFHHMWPHLLTLAVLPDVVLVCLWWVHGSARWFLAGVIVSIGPWLAAGTVVVFSGAAPKWMGRMGEAWTADELRHAHKQGWRHINDAYLTNQIDHLAIGPGGLLVVETKWRAEPWPSDERSAAQRIRQQAGKIEVLLRNRNCLVPVTPVVVLWHPPTEKDPSPVDVVDGVTVVDGAYFGPGSDHCLQPRSETRRPSEHGTCWLRTPRPGTPTRKLARGPLPVPSSSYFGSSSHTSSPVLGGLLTACLAAEFGSWKGIVAASAAGLAPIPLSLRHRLRRYVWTWTGSVAVLILAGTVVFVGHRL